MNRRSSRRRRNRAFTLMEILLVLAILVVLASMVGVSYSRIQKSMQISSARTQLGLLEEAVKAYQIGVGSLPPDLNALLQAPGDLPNPAKWQGPYLDKSTLPVDPWDQQFQYEIVDPANDKFKIFSAGPDRQPGSSDDIETAL
jgi:general secretion pathway protein G